MPETLAPKPVEMFEKDNLSALQAISHAQAIAFAPYVFQASVLLRDRGLLNIIENKRNLGADLDEVISGSAGMSRYAVRILLEAGLGIGLLYRRDDNFFLTKAGHFFLNDKMTRVNTDFMKDVCYDGAKDLGKSLDEAKPHGLPQLGPWETIYEGLSALPQPAKSSWFAFDHFYSDHAFPEALKIIFDDESAAPKRMMDVGSNTGKFAIACLHYNPEVFIGLVDLQIQLDVASKNLEGEGYAGRYTTIPHNVLHKDAALPKGYDAIWMSQFLDCFADEEIVSILEKCYEALPAGGKVYINETFWDRQRFPASAFSLQMTSLYFTTMANGNSQMYDSKVFIALIGRTGFELMDQIDQIGLGHSMIVLKKP